MNEVGEMPVQDQTDADYTFFQTIPWCNDILSDPEFTVRARPREYNETTTEEALFNQTLNTSSTTQAFLSLLRRTTQDSTVDEVRTLLHLGSGLNSHPGLCHGGIIATVMDEIMGVLLAVNRNWVQSATATAYLNTRYLKPVRTPQAVLVTARFTRVEGRKYFLHAELVNGEEEVLAEAEALFVKLKTVLS